MRLLVILISILLSYGVNASDILSISKVTIANPMDYEYSDSLLINEELFEKLSLHNLKHYDEHLTYESLSWFEGCYLGDTIYNGQFGKIITLHLLSGGEAVTYLISYNAENKYQDSLIVAYQDVVEYLSETKSIIEANKIQIVTLQYHYDHQEYEEPEKDIRNYKITTELKFEEQANS